MLSDFRTPAGNYDIPVTERQLAAVIGRSAAIRLSWRIWQRNPYRGRGKRGILYVPASLTASFVDRVGSQDVAEKLLRVYSGGRLELCGCTSVLNRLRSHCIRKLNSHGATREQIAAATGLSERNIRRICQDHEKGDRWADEVISRRLSELHALSWLLQQNPLRK